MSTDESADERTHVTASRRIAAPPAVIFGLLADPERHLELDGSGMLRGARTTRPVTAVGDVFVMRMWFDEIGDYEMENHVVEFEQDRRIAWVPLPGRGHPSAVRGRGQEEVWRHRWGYTLVPLGPTATSVTETYDCAEVPAADRAEMDGGRVWLDAMTETLARLDRAVAHLVSRSAAPAPRGRGRRDRGSP